MAARRRLRHPCQLCPGIAPPRSWGFSRAVRRVVLGTTDPEGWVGDSERGEGRWGCPLALLHRPRVFSDEKVPGPSFLLAGILRLRWGLNFRFDSRPRSGGHRLGG